VLTAAAELAAPGSRLAVDLVNAGFFRFHYTRDYLASLDAAGTPWRFGTDTPEQLLTDCGWRVDSNLPRSYLLTATCPD